MGKHDPDIEINEVRVVNYTQPSYSGTGANRVGSTLVTIRLEFSDGSNMDDWVQFDNINVTTHKYLEYNVGIYVVTIRVTVTTEGTNNNMNITGATADIDSKTVIH